MRIRTSVRQLRDCERKWPHMRNFPDWHRRFASDHMRMCSQNPWASSIAASPLTYAIDGKTATGCL